MPKFEYDKDYPFAAFVTNLGKYNEGELVGEWVKFPTTAEEMQAVFKRIGIGETDDFGCVYEEWFITDYDCYVDGLYDKLGEYSNIDELNYLAFKLDDMIEKYAQRFQTIEVYAQVGNRTIMFQVPQYAPELGAQNWDKLIQDKLHRKPSIRDKLASAKNECAEKHSQERNHNRSEPQL